MATAQNKYESAVELCEGIRDERKISANTAYRIGSAMLALLNFAAENGQYLSRLKDDVAKGVITFEQGVKALGGVFFGNWLKGVDGACIDAEGLAELAAATVRKNITVGGDATMGGSLSSPDFVSGFVGGRGWRIWRQMVTNAAGAEEAKYTGEIDELVVRGAMRIFTLVVSQLLGENDNRIFTAMLEVDHYDAESGKVWLSTQNGKLYNPFRKGDYIMVQQYNGMPSEDNGHYITKHYECIVTEAGCGDTEDGEDRLDWVTIKAFESSDGRTAAESIAKGDTFCRVDNETDDERKGIIQVMTVGSATPYMDVTYGLKTEPENALKGRWGNLSGIRHPYWGWLGGFGEYLCNLYGVGDFLIRRTGESVDQQISMLKGLFSTQFQRESYELTDADNYLYNSSFLNNMDGWMLDADEDAGILTIGNSNDLFISNGSTVVTGEHTANVEEYDGKQMLRIKNIGISQKNELIRKPSTHKEYVTSADDSTTAEYKDVQDTIYLTIKFLAKTDGLLTIGFKYYGEYNAELTNTLPYTEDLSIKRSDDWVKLEWKGTWHGLGDFYLKYTGEMFVSLLAITCKDIDEFKKTTETRIIQDDRNIQLLGLNIDKTNNTVTELGIELRAADKELKLYVNELAENYYTKAEIDVTVGEIRLSVSSLSDEIYSTLGSYYTKSEIDIKVGEINLSVSSLNTKLEIQDAANKEAFEELQSLLSDANAAIDEAKDATSDLEDYVNGAFEDGIIDQAEKIAIEKHLNNIESTKKNIDSTCAELIGNPYLEGTTILSTLKTANADFNTQYTNLVNAINTAIADNAVTSSEKTSVNNAFTAYNSSLATLSTVMEDANKAIQDYLKNYTDTKLMGYYTRSEIDITVDGIEQSVTKVSTDLSTGLNSVGKQISALQSQLSDANAAIDEARDATSDLENYVHGAFEDGIIDQAEKIAIEKHLNNIESTKKEVDSTYSILSGNPNLPSTQLSNLTSAKDSLNSYYTTLVNTINTTIADGKATDTEVASVKSAFTNFNTALGTFSQRVQECHKAIDAYLKSYSETLKQQALDYADSVSAPEYIESSSNPYNNWSSTSEAKKHLGLLWKYTGTSSVTTFMIPDATGTMRPGITNNVYRYVGFAGDNKWEDVTQNSTSVALTKNYGDKIVTVCGAFDNDGNLKECAGQTLTAFGNSLWASKTTVSDLSGLVATHTTQIANNASAISLKASTEYVDDLSGRIGELSSEISATSEEISLKVSADSIISAINMTSETVKISSSKIQLEGYTTINSSFSVDTNGVTHIGGFKVSGNGLTNDPFTNDAYVIFRNDSHACFAGIGGNVLPASSGIRGVARFENEDTSDWWGLSANYTLLLSAKNAAENVAINIAGGHIRGLALKTQIIGLDTIVQSSEPGTLYKTIDRSVNFLLASTQYTHKTSSTATGSVKTRNVYLTLPTMYDYDDGHVIFIKRGSSDNGTLTIAQGGSYHNENGSNVYYANFFILNNDVETRFSFNLDYEGNALMLVYFRDITWTYASGNTTTTYKGAWVQWKLPRDW